jgi:hypothetical protein
VRRDISALRPDISAQRTDIVALRPDIGAQRTDIVALRTECREHRRGGSEGRF